MYLCGLGGLLNLSAGRVSAAIGDVVIDGVVEQNSVLRYDANRLVQAQLRDISNVLPVY